MANGAQQPTTQHGDHDKSNETTHHAPNGYRPTPSFKVIAWTLQQASNLRHLGLKKSLQVLLLRLNVTPQLISLHLHLALDGCNLGRLPIAVSCMECSREACLCIKVCIWDSRDWMRSWVSSVSIGAAGVGRLSKTASRIWDLSC